jgi:hypothetical protein
MWHRVVLFSLLSALIMSFICIPGLNTRRCRSNYIKNYVNLIETSGGMESFSMCLSRVGMVGWRVVGHICAGTVLAN